MLRLSSIPCRKSHTADSFRRGILPCDTATYCGAGTLHNLFHYIVRGRSLPSCRFRREAASLSIASVFQYPIVTTKGERTVPVFSHEGFGRDVSLPGLPLFYAIAGLPHTALFDKAERPVSAYTAGGASLLSAGDRRIPLSTLFHTSTYPLLTNQNFKTAGERPMSAPAGAVPFSRAGRSARRELALSSFFHFSPYISLLTTKQNSFISEGRPAAAQAGAAPFLNPTVSATGPFVRPGGCRTTRCFITDRLDTMSIVPALATVPASPFFQASPNADKNTPDPTLSGTGRFARLRGCRNPFLINKSLDHFFNGNDNATSPASSFFSTHSRSIDGCAALRQHSATGRSHPSDRQRTTESVKRSACSYTASRRIVPVGGDRSGESSLAGACIVAVSSRGRDYNCKLGISPHAPVPIVQ